MQLVKENYLTNLELFWEQSVDFSCLLEKTYQVQSSTHPSDSIAFSAVQDHARLFPILVFVTHWKSPLTP